MGYGQIIGGGPTARYTVRLDYGEAVKASTLAALNEQLVKVTNDLSAAQSKLATAEANAAAERNAVSGAINAFIAAGGTGNLNNTAVQAAMLFLEQSRKAVIAAERLTVPERLKVDALTITKAQIVEYIARWNAAVTIQTKDCWCTDYTESGTGYVATIDIDGESGLTLIAPGCRAWQGGDGTISLTRKAEAVAQLNERLLRAEEELVSANSALATAIGVEESARADLNAAQAAYKSAPTELLAAKADEVAYALKFWHDCMAKTGEARIRQSRAQNRVDSVSVQLADWEAKPASETPEAGDGVMFATDVMSPEQYYWNLAAMPAWQKFRPTYRWGTLTALDKDANLATVSLANATSSQQSLGINQTSTLTNIPVVYMTCNARAFEVNDRVVVQFIGQEWSNPRVIGFLDNPRPCIQYVATYYVIGYGPLSSGNNHLLDTLERDKDEAWGNFSTVTPVAPWKFIQWSDGVTSLTRNDGTATTNISRTARYTYAPNFRVAYSWTVEAYSTSGTYFSGGNFVKDWEVRVTGAVAWSAIGYPTTPTSPASTAIDAVVWSGQALDGVTPDDVMFNLTDTYLGQTETPGPIYFPSYPSSTTQTAVFVLAGSANQYTVNGTAGTEPFPVGVIPATASGAGAITTIDYTATSWSAVYL